MAVVACTACSEAGGEEVERSSAALYGEPSGPEDNAVVWMGTPLGKCTGTLIAKNLVLTALHCLADQKPGDFSCSPSGKLENAGSGGGELGPPVEPELISFGSVLGEPLAWGRRVFSTHSVTACVNDLALVELDREIDLPVMPIELDEPPLHSDRMTVVGYGMTWPGVSARQRQSGAKVLEVGVPPRTFTVKANACSGDSGGPAINERTGAVAGVCTAQAFDCASPHAVTVYTALNSFNSLIRNAFESSGATPWLAGEAGPSARAGKNAKGGDTSTNFGCSLVFTRCDSSARGALVATLGFMTFGLRWNRRRRARLVQRRRAE